MIPAPELEERAGGRGPDGRDAIRKRASDERAAAGVRADSLRVAVVSDAVPGRNGVGTYYDDLVRHLAPRVGAIRLVAPPEEGEDDRGGWRLPMPGDPTQTLFVPRPARIEDELSALDPDVVIAPTPGLYGLVAMILAGRSGAAFCVAYHTEFPKLAEMYWREHLGLGRLARWFGLALDGFMFRNAAAVLVHNARLRRSVVERGVREAPLMGTPAAPSFLSEPLRPLGERLETVTFVGRVAPEKEVGQVLELARRRPELEVRIVGDGPLRDEVEACARERPNLEFLGWVSRPRVRAVLDGSDLVVLPSRHETFGTAAFEAMTRRRPVLVSPHCGIVEWPDLAPGLFRMEEGEELVDAVARVRGFDPDSRLRVAEAGQEAAAALSRRTVDHWVEVLNEVAGRRTRR